MSSSKTKIGPGAASALIGITIALVACHSPAVTGSGSAKPVAGSADSGTKAEVRKDLQRDATSVTIIHHESYALCPDSTLESGLNLFDDAKSWQGFLKSTAQRAPQLLEWKPNFSTSRVLVFRLGSKATAGYSVRAQNATIAAKGAELSLYVRSGRPQAGSFNATVITAPCVVANLAAADFKAISVIDDSDGTVLGRITQ
jgi:PrcB C-terminal